METIAGIVTHVRKKPEEGGSGLYVVRYETAGGMVEAKASSRSLALEVGDWFLARGEWRPNVFRGRTEHIFNAVSVKPDLPATRDGAVVFLSRIFEAGRHGATPASIRAFVEAHGAAACRKAEQNPEILTGITSDPARFRGFILADWARRLSNRRAVVAMSKAGVDDHAIGRILEAYKDDTWKVLRENPYVVSRVPDVGFPNADKLGSDMGIPPGDERRIESAVLSALDRARSEGSTGLPAVRASEEAAALLGRDAGTTGQVENWLLAAAGRRDGPVRVDRSPKGFVVHLPEMLVAEAYVARRIVDMLRVPPAHAPERVSAAIERVFAGNRKFARFDAVQREAVRSAALSQVFILTGGPGTGKTTVTEALIAVLEDLGHRRIDLVAPTGKAAKRASAATKRKASTLHRRLLAREDKRTGGSMFGVNRENPLPAGTVLLVDETSMIDAQTMAAVVDALPPDGRLVLIGDPHQLPSVGAGNVLADLLSARTGNRPLVPSVGLANIYRQEETSSIARESRTVKDGKVPFMDNKVRGGLAFYEHDASGIADEVVRLVTGPMRTQLGLDPARDVAVMSPQAPGPAGTWDLNARLSAALNPGGRAIEGVFHGPRDDPKMPLPRVGDRVMATRNDEENDVFNGDVGTIVGVEDRSTEGRQRRVIKVAFDPDAAGARPKIVEHPVSRWRELILAYACTIHKMQGSQATAAVIVASGAHAGMLDRTILYTGWTRPEELLFVVGERSALEDAVSRRASDLRWTRLAEFVERAALECGFAPARREAARPAQAVPVTPGSSTPPRVVPPSVPGAGVPASLGGPPRVRVHPLPGSAPAAAPDAAAVRPEPARAVRPAVPRIVLPRPAPPSGPGFGG
ncbi:ATP-dependent RecD-like DNA helicase [Methylobacterium hispanicum]|uniref:ATP-dependent RecD-like DNA helicase n=1 Tax=Methylobacterium hispanicum TaxID=270350 RepID=A0AAV4ZGV4_9HYPH|nr:AAA family ATPase [Methylobacterium hispanicum]GJD87666.1 ATP-dependent RecD-like DNA helicase [Methylobacterium hispanicum]